MVLLLSLRLLVVAIQAELPTQKATGAGLAVEPRGSSPTPTSAQGYRGAGASARLSTTRSARHTAVEVFSVVELGEVALAGTEAFVVVVRRTEVHHLLDLFVQP